MSVLLAPSAALAHTVDAKVSVEAEYGSVVVQGSLFTAAHHQKSGPFSTSENPAPCNNPAIPHLEKDDTILVSHLDLDTLGGVLRTVEAAEALFEAKHDAFWQLAEFVDLNGPHRLGESGASEELLLRLYTVWGGWSVFLPRFPRDEITDVSQWVVLGWELLTRILIDEDEDTLEQGHLWKEAQDELNESTFHSLHDGIIFRVDDQPSGFCNHLYVAPDGTPAKAVVCLNTGNGSITVSLADPIEGVSCRELVQGLWGPEAGGHDGIAGSPRERTMTPTDATDLIDRLAALLR